jgi:hypothetical protein
MEQYRFGKLAPKHDYRTFRIKKYLKASLEEPPASYDVLVEQVYKILNISNPAVLFPMDGNDIYGDCTIAALAHAITVYRGKVGEKQIMARKNVVKLYKLLTGGPDSGMFCLDVLNYWRQNAVVGDKILAFAKVDWKNHTQVKQAIKLFGGVYLGFQCQEDCVEDFKHKKPWTPGPLVDDGHCVHTVGYDDTSVTVLTWGNIQKGTWEWWDECVDEAYAILPPEATKPEFDPGFDYEQLKADLDEVAIEPPTLRFWPKNPNGPHKAR